MKRAKNIGKYPIWLKGSRITIHRNVYELDGKCYVKWCGIFIEVVHGVSGYATVKMY